MALATIATTAVGLQGRSIATTTPTANQVFGWNGSAWGPLPPLLPLTGGTLTGNVITPSTIWSTGGTVQSPSSAGTYLNGAGVNILTGKAANRWGVLTTSSVQVTTASAQQGGFGGTFQLAPQVTGRLLVSLRPIAWNVNAPASVLDIAMTYGTGTPPAANAPQIGTAIPINLQCASSIGMSYNFAAVILGLTIGATYWFDTIHWVSAGSTGYYAFMTLTLTEF